MPEPGGPLSLPDRSSIAVLPFVQSNEDFEAQAFADYERSGWIRCFVGKPETAAAQLRAAERLSPLDNAALRFDSGLSFALCMLREYEAAAACARRAMLATPT